MTSTVRVAVKGLMAMVALWAASLSLAKAAPTVTSCVPVAVAVFVPGPRIHVQCAAAVGGISYFATPTSDVASAARVLSILSTAQVAGRTLGIRYDPADLSGSGIGCQNSDCRLIMEVWFGQ